MQNICVEAGLHIGSTWRHGDKSYCMLWKVVTLMNVANGVQQASVIFIHKYMAWLKDETYAEIISWW